MWNNLDIDEKHIVVVVIVLWCIPLLMRMGVPLFQRCCSWVVRYYARRLLRFSDDKNVEVKILRFLVEKRVKTIKLVPFINNGTHSK